MTTVILSVYNRKPNTQKCFERICLGLSSNPNILNYIIRNMKNNLRIFGSRVEKITRILVRRTWSLDYLNRCFFVVVLGQINL